MSVIRAASAIAASHSPGVQPHGIVLILRDEDLAIEHVSDNTTALLGISAGSVVGRTLRTLMREDDARTFESRLRHTNLSALNPLPVTLIDNAGHAIAFACSVHRRDGSGLIVEFEPAGDDAGDRVAVDVQAPIERLQNAADIASLLACAARDVRDISGFERVMISRIETSWESEVVAESTAPGVDLRFQGSRFPAGDIPDETRTIYLRHALRLIADTEETPAGLVAAGDAGSADLSRATLRGVSPFERAYVRSMGARASMTISIVVRGELWGVIACYHSRPYRLDYARRTRCELIGHMLEWQLGIRIDAAIAQRRAREAALIAAIDKQLDEHADLAGALIAAAPLLFELFRADGLAVFLNDATARCGNVPADDAVLAAAADAVNEHGARTGTVAQTHDLRALLPALRDTPFAGALCIRLSDVSRGFVFLCRPESVRTIVWAGDPAAQSESDVTPRRSFEPWPQTVERQSEPWSPADISAANVLAAHVLARLHLLAQHRADRITNVNAGLEARNAQAQALITLQHSVAAALPSRDAVIDVILRFAQRQTNAAGCVLETFTERDVVFDVAVGSLAPVVGGRLPRAGSFSAGSVEGGAPLICDDASTGGSDAERALCSRLGVGSMAVVPIVLSSDTTIAIKVVAAQRRAFRRDDIATLNVAASNLQSALRAAQKFTELAAAEREQRTYARALRALHAIASATTSHGKEQIDAALRLGLEQLGLDWAFLGVIDGTSGELVIESSVSTIGHLAVAQATRLPLRDTTFGRAGSARSVTIVRDVAETNDAPANAGWASLIAAPLIIGNANYGAIGFTSRDVRGEPFSEENVEFVAVAAELIASAIERGLQRDELEKSQTRYRALTEALPQMMWVIDAQNEFEYVNERWTEYTGLTLAQSRWAERDTVFHPDDLSAIDLRGTLPAADSDCEVRLRRADGAYHWHLMRSVPFRAAGEDVDKWLVTATDIEARKSAEAVLADVHSAALAATQAKSRFLATMSHEIRTPMNGVIGMTELLLLTTLNDEQREYTEVIRDSGQSLLRVLNDILDYSKIEAGKLELEKVQFDLPGQVESVVELLRPGFMGKDVSLTMQIAPDVRTTVVGDPGRLRQILLNLTGNALKFTPSGGAVEISVTASAAADAVAPVRFAIKDTGIGIPGDVLERLFQPFSQGDESTTRKYGGTGLGLSISAELVALMDGAIGVESTPDIGSEFWFAIPFRLAPNSRMVAETHDRHTKRAKPAPLRAERILLVEDNEINTFLALKQLQRLGFAITAVTNGRQAVDTIARERYDLVFMDCHMPEMDGFEATRAIRKLEAGSERRLPIVAMTADARDEDHQNCLAAGMDDYISKPTNLDSLRAVLDRWLPAPERRRAHRNGGPPLSLAPTLGMSMLLELFNGDRAAVLELLMSALSSIGTDLARIEAASAARDFETVSEAAHRLKGTSGGIRAGRLVEISAGIESEARANPAFISANALADLRAAVAAVTAEVHQQRKSESSQRPDR